MPISQAGALNTTALVVPDLYVQIVPPQTLYLNGVPTNLIGLVGTASWGPVGEAVVVGTASEYAASFGPVMPRTFDMGTVLAAAVMQGASNFSCVRVTDGTDTAASVSILGALTLTALYTGSLGNSLVANITAGSAAGSWAITIAMPGGNVEVFNNITGTGNAFWVAAAAAINNGNGPLRGPSRYVAATAGASSLTPSAGAFPFSSGTPGSDGASSVTSGMLIGQDVSPRTGMYALRGQNVGILAIADLTDTTQWSVVTEFGLQEGCYCIVAFAAGGVISTAVSTLQSTGAASYALKVLHGDWIWWNDQTNGVLRLISPVGFAAGTLGNLSPEQSSLNKQMFGIVGTQKTGAGGATASAYSTADLAELISGGIDVICNPQPGGSYFGCRSGHNSSPNEATNGDNYTRMTNYIADTLAAGMGVYVGQLITSTLFLNIKSTLLSFLSNMLGQGMLGSTNGSLPYAVSCSFANNPLTRTSLGYVQADVQVQYLGINEKFIVNVEGGQTVTVSQAGG